MKALTTRQLSHVLFAELRGAPDRVITRIATDSRQVQAGDLFFALRGEHFDGHAFIADVLAKGALPVVSRADALSEGAPGLVVADTQAALEALARALRDLHPGKVIAVTGSVGKTTVKDMIAAALAESGPIAKTIGNYNNHIGLPLTLAATNGEERVLVLELGMSAPGEICRLTHLARPDVAVVTCAAAAHLEFFAGVDAIADAKAELYEHMGPHARAVANADDERMLARARRFAPEALTFGRAVGADVRVLDARHVAHGLAVELDARGLPIHLELAALGLHQATNAACAVAACMALGVAPVSAAASLARNFTPPKHRLQPLRLGHLAVLDDCYNASPSSMQAALATFSELSAGATRGAILGSMRELGPTADALHQDIGRLARGLDFVACTGAHAEALASGAREVGVPEVRVAGDVMDLTAPIAAFARRAHHLLVKGSRGERLERIFSVLEMLDPQDNVPTAQENG